jgi:hypothetical protein
MEIKGKLIKIMPTQQGTSQAGKVWSKADFVIETEGQYPKKIAITAMGDLIAKLPSVGSNVTAHINIESREYNEKWYTNVNLWKIDVLTEASPF